MQRQAQVVREGGFSPSQAVRYVVYLEGRKHSAHASPAKALTVLSDIGVPHIVRVAKGTLLYEATIRPRGTTAGRVSPSWHQAAAENSPSQTRLYVHRHVVAQPKWNGHAYGATVPTPHYNDLMAHATKVTMPGHNPYSHRQTFQHQFTHNGKPVAKLEYGIYPLADASTIHVSGLAVHPDHRGDGLASSLMDHMQQHAHEHGRKIDHGSRTPAGYKWWQRYSKGESFSPSVHHPSEGDHGPDPRLRSEDTYDALFDDHEHRQGRTATVGWTHYYANQTEGWER